MKSVVLGASKPKKWKPLAAAIMWWEETPASHVYFYIKRPSGVHLLYQAVGSGTEFMGYEEFCQINTPVYEKEVGISDEAFHALLDYLIPKLKQRYSVKHLFGLFIKRVVWYYFKKNIPNYFSDKDVSSVCVEALFTMVEAQKICKLSENPEDMGMYEALATLRGIPGKELL